MICSINIVMSDGPNGLTNITARTSAATHADAMAGVELVSEWIGKGRQRLIRRAPSVTEDIDFATGVREFRGYVRFAFGEQGGADVSPYFTSLEMTAQCTGKTGGEA